MSYVVYCIIDPRNHQPFYIGYTSNFDRRRRQHIETGHGASGFHIDQIRANGFIPLFAILETTRTYRQALRCETFWIELFTTRGLPLLNKENPAATGPANAGKPWTRAADHQLEKLYAARTPLAVICADLARTRGSIKSRLRHLGLYLQAETTSRNCR